MVSSPATISFGLFSNFLTGLELPPWARNYVIIVMMGDYEGGRPPLCNTSDLPMSPMPINFGIFLGNNGIIFSDSFSRTSSSVYFLETETWTGWNTSIAFITIIGRRTSGFRNSALLLLGNLEPPTLRFLLFTIMDEQQENKPNYSLNKYKEHQSTSWNITYILLADEIS